MIHRIILEELACCTVIMVTHKLDHVFEYDKVMVLDNGGIVEFDQPSILFNNENGFFHKKSFLTEILKVMVVVLVGNNSQF
jgi:ABC-type multidrug transport system fused ATPase/permease subunit